MGVNFKVYKDSFISRVKISEENDGDRVIVRSVTDNDPTFKYLHSTWTIDTLDEVRIWPSKDP